MDQEITTSAVSFPKQKNIEFSEEKEEIWKDIPGYEGLYKISNLGRIKRLERTYHIKSEIQPISVRPEFIIKQRLDAGYQRISLYNKEKKTKILFRP